MCQYITNVDNRYIEEKFFMFYFKMREILTYQRYIYDMYWQLRRGSKIFHLQQFQICGLIKTTLALYSFVI